VIKHVFTVGDDVVEKPRWDGTVFLAGPIERVPEGEKPRFPRWRDYALKYLDARPEKLVVYNPEWTTRPLGWTYQAQVEWEFRAISNAMVRLFWIDRRLPGLPGFTTNIEWGKWWDDACTVSGAPPDAPHTRYMQTLHRFVGKPWCTNLQQCCDVAVGRLLHSGPWTLVGVMGADGKPLPDYCAETGWPEPAQE